MGIGKAIQKYIRELKVSLVPERRIETLEIFMNCKSVYKLFEDVTNDSLQNDLMVGGESFWRVNQRLGLEYEERVNAEWHELKKTDPFCARFKELGKEIRPWGKPRPDYLSDLLQAIRVRYYRETAKKLAADLSGLISLSGYRVVVTLIPEEGVDGDLPFMVSGNNFGELVKMSNLSKYWNNFHGGYREKDMLGRETVLFDKSFGYNHHLTRITDFQKYRIRKTISKHVNSESVIEWLRSFWSRDLLTRSLDFDKMFDVLREARVVVVDGSSSDYARPDPVGLDRQLPEGRQRIGAL